MKKIRGVRFDLGLCLCAVFVIAMAFLITSPARLDVSAPPAPPAPADEPVLALATLATLEALEATVAPTPTPTPTPVPTPSPSPTLIPLKNSSTNIDKNSKPKSIKAVQQRLALLGYYEGETDGVFSQETKDAVSAFQRANSLMINPKSVSIKMQSLLASGVKAVNALGEKGFIKTGEADAQATPAPTATPAPDYVPVKLPMNDFSGGAKPIKENFTPYSYSDPSITVNIVREKVDRSVFTSAEVTISDPSQLRTALGGSMKRASTARISKIAQRNNAVVAINGDFYTHRGTNYIVRQSNAFRRFSEGKYDLLIIDALGDFHVFKAKDSREGFENMTESVYQVFSFGPALIIDGEKQPTPKGYDFGPNAINPRTAIGQIGPGHYMLLVVDGRTDYSFGVETKDLTNYMYDHGCVQAYNLDGGGSSAMYFGGRIVNNMTSSGERSIPDIIYFASTAGIGKEAAND